MWGREDLSIEFDIPGGGGEGEEELADGEQENKRNDSRKYGIWTAVISIGSGLRTVFAKALVAGARAWFF